MPKVYHLATCSTCARILRETGLAQRTDFVFQDTKTQPLTAAQLDELARLAGGYEPLFSRVALKYRALDPKPAAESEYRHLILEEYTFLKRPVVVIGEEVFIGNAKRTVAALRQVVDSSFATQP